MLTPGPALARRPRFTRPGWKGMGFRGLGQDVGFDTSSIDTSGGTTTLNCNPQTGQCADGSGTTLPSGNTPSSQSGNINWTQIATSAITATGKAVTAYQTNPLLHLQPGMYYQQTPGGGMIVSTAGVPYGSSALTTTTMGNLLPIILIGGVFVMFMMGRR